MKSLQRHLRNFVNSLTWRKSLKYLSWIALLLIIVSSVWLFRLNSEIRERLKSGWFKPPVEIYARGDQFRVGSKLLRDQIQKQLLNLGYRERTPDQTLHAGDFVFWDADQCAKASDTAFTDGAHYCLEFRITQNLHSVADAEKLSYIVGFDELSSIQWIKQGWDFELVDSLELRPQVFAQFYDGEPILRKVIDVGDAPIECLQAVTAIEDSQFLEHRGVSPTGLARALLRNLFSGRYAQGGSTITQQLVKNYFLTAEKTLKRKFIEIFLAILLEANTDKDQILSTYLNVIYMGQRGPFQVIGLSAASDYYFNTPLANLQLPECALLAAIINSPGRYNPFKSPEATKKRRDFVLERMVETEMISQTEANNAKTVELPKEVQLRLTDPAPYFIQAVFRDLKKMNISTEQGLKIFTTLDVEAQSIAQEKVLAHVRKLESQRPAIKELKESGKSLESLLISVDIPSGEVLALVGGRQYLRTQYNRVLDAHRQVGSIMKPFVYLTALESRNSEGERYTPITQIDDSEFTYNYEGQSWTPKNYDGDFNGPVPLFYALKNSLNVATARLGIEVGLSNVVDVAKRAGIESDILPYPSLTLGAFEIYPWEVTTGFLTLARFGERVPLTTIRRVESLAGQIIFQEVHEPVVEFPPQTVATLISMLKQTFKTGTARFAEAYGFHNIAAGKTGTTSDTKDAWFAGFTPSILTITWTGYDDNTPSGLTGASGALPLWVDFMKAYTQHLPNEEFKWPKGTDLYYITPEQLKTLAPSAKLHELQESVELVR